MEKTNTPKQLDNSKDEYLDLLQTLEKRRNWSGRWLCRYNGFWYPERSFRAILCAQKHFKAHDTDIILSTMPKSGTTWIKALTFSIINRNHYSIDKSPLLASNPHALVPFFEFDTYLDHENPKLENMPSPRIFATHIPYDVLPSSIQNSDCKIIYIWRNPMDVFVSLRHFLIKNKIEDGVGPISIDDAFEMFCDGTHSFGPFWDHLLGYWNAHLKAPQKVLFLKYEDLKEDIMLHVKKIAEFIGVPFSLEEEKEGVIEQISRLCSFENLKNLEANKIGQRSTRGTHPNNSYFRKGEVGDWANHLTPQMAARVEKIMETKMDGSGLVLNEKW